MNILKPQFPYLSNGNNTSFLSLSGVESLWHAPRSLESVTVSFLLYNTFHLILGKMLFFCLVLLLLALGEMQVNKIEESWGRFITLLLLSYPQGFVLPMITLIFVLSLLFFSFFTDEEVWDTGFTCCLFSSRFNVQPSCTCPPLFIEVTSCQD